MQSSTNQRDLTYISNAIMDGDVTLDSLPDVVQQGIMDKWASDSGASLETGPTQEQINELYQKRQEQTKGFLDSPIFKPIEWVGSKLYWLYSNTVSPIFSTAAMATHSLIYGRPDYIGEDGEWDAIKDYWNLSKSVSPGQAVWMLGLNNDELKQRGISPQQMAADKAAALEGRVPEGQTVSDKYFKSGGMAQFTSGLTDFAVSWWADPLVLAGKGAGAARSATQIRPVAPAIEKAGKQAKKTGQQTFDVFAQKPVFQSMVDTVMNIKQANPNTAALVMRRDLKTVSASKDGDSLARLLEQAKDADEVSDILRVSMGDMGGVLALQAKNIKISGQIEQLNKKITAHTAYYNGMTPAQQGSALGVRVKAAIDAENDFVMSLNRQTGVIDDRINAFGQIDNMNYNSITTPLSLKVRGSSAVRDGGKLKPIGKDAAGGYVRAAGNLVYNASIGMPIKLVRSYNDIRPTAYIDIHAEDSYRNVGALLEEAPSLDRATRERMVNQYIKAAPADRQLALIKMETEAVASMITRYNSRLKPGQTPLTHEMGMALYKDFATRRRQGQVSTSGGRAYGSGTFPDPAGGPTPLNTATIEADGSRMITTPIFETQLANSHVMLDFKSFDRMLKEQGSNFQKTFNAARNAAEWTVSMADTLGTYWKFAQLFRLGYAPRALADDFLGQLARFGPVAMLGRSIEGGKITASDFFRGRWAVDDIEMARQGHALESARIDTLMDEQQTLQRLINDPTATGIDRMKLQDDLTMLGDELDLAHAKRNIYSTQVAEGAATKGMMIGRQPFEGAFSGVQGRLFKDLASGERNLDNLIGSEASFGLKRARRQDWSNISYTHEGHSDAWLRKVNNQIAHSAIGREVLKGKTEAQLVHWMRSTEEGRLYRQKIGLKHMPDDELAQRVKAEVDYTLDPSIPGMDVVRQQALDGKLEKSMLEATVPMKARPDVNAQSWSYATGENPVAKALDSTLDWYFKVANQLPAQKLLRNPLFAQQYKADLTNQMRTLRAQGITKVDEATRIKMQENARKAALRDVKRYTFTMDHETKLAYSLRHFGAFFGAQQESWNRWARIISEKPETLAHVAQTYGAPTRSGITVDQDGNTIDAAGFTTDPVTGEKKLTKYSERKMLIQIPDYLGGQQLKKDLGLDPDAVLTMPLSSAELVLNNGDGVFPVGAGPLLQIGVNEFAKDDPGVADWSKRLGVLPFGPQDSVLDFINPNTGKRLGDSMDDFSESRQRNMFYMMQVENYKYETGQRKDKPTWSELKDRADRWSIARAAFAFALPLSINAQDPYQFFRDEFQRYQKLDPDSADQKFYDKYGDSFYMFAQSMSKNNTGLRPTQEAVYMSQHYQDLIDKVGPEYAGLIVGDEGDGAYSNGAYFYQKTHSAGPASSTAQRTTMSASEAWKEANEARGWKQYNSVINSLYAELFDGGFKTFADAGAELLKERRDATVSVLSDPELPDGTTNPFYNKAWSEAFNSLDKNKYDRRASDIWTIVNDPELWAKAQPTEDGVGIRSDIFTMRGYLEQRRNFQMALNIRKAEGGSDDPLAQSNSDLKEQWDQMVMYYIEQDTKFSWLHNRWFSGDMGFNLNTMIEEE